MSREWITGRELRALKELERRRERRAKLRCAVIVGLCLVFWVAVLVWFFGRGTP